MNWFLARKWIIVVAALLLAAIVIFYWPDLYAACGWFGNVASVLGLLVSLVGFMLTIWTVLQTQRMSKDAQEKIQKAFSEAQEETRSAVERIGLHLLVTETDILLQIIMGLRQAGVQGQWQLAMAHCMEARLATMRLAGNPHLHEEENETLRSGGEDLNLIHRYIERERLGADAVIPGLPDQKTKALDKMISALGQLQARLRKQTLEVPNADEP